MWELPFAIRSLPLSPPSFLQNLISIQVEELKIDWSTEEEKGRCFFRLALNEAKGALVEDLLARNDLIGSSLLSPSSPLLILLQPVV